MTKQLITLPRRPLARWRIAAAWVVAVTADLIQIPLNAAFFALVSSIVGSPAALTTEAVDGAVDVVVAALTSWLIGFHWALLPTFALELVPGLSAAPTWSGCVAFVLWRRRAEARGIESHGAVPDPSLLQENRESRRLPNTASNAEE